MEILNNVKSFREFIMFKYKSENTAKNYGSALAFFLSHFKDLKEPKDINADMLVLRTNTGFSINKYIVTTKTAK